MRKTQELRSILYRLTVVSGCLLTGMLMSGCSEKAPQLEVKVASPVGRPGTCASCNKKIENVTKEHLITVNGIEYVVCDEKCAAKLKEWLAKQ